MINNREVFLDNVAANLGRPRRKGGVKRPDWTVRPQDEVLSEMSQDDLVEVLKKQCEIIHTDFVLTDKEGLHTSLNNVIRSYGGEKIIVSKDSRNKKYKLQELYKELEAKGKVIHFWDYIKGQENISFAERSDIGITFSDITLAESGTVTLFNNQNNGRSISLLPKYYIAIIPKSTIVPRMTQATNQIHQVTKSGQQISSCISFITGPSNSADIEMNLIVGVHGPIKATYIVVDD